MILVGHFLPPRNEFLLRTPLLYEYSMKKSERCDFIQAGQLLPHRCSATCQTVCLFMHGCIEQAHLVQQDSEKRA